jgi:KaiC/GvpD/RAD55 family RecA-like ATPase
MKDIRDELGDVTNVLLGAPSLAQGTDQVCVDLLTQGDPEEMKVLWVSFTKPADACLSQWRAQHDVDPATFGAIVVGDTVGDENAGNIDSQAVQRITNPSDLTGIGIKVGEFVSAQEGQIVVCVDSLTALLQYVDLETAYEFLHALTGQLYSAGAVSHFHIDPSAHSDEEVDTLLSLFDASVELGGEEPEVRTRYPLE